MKRQSRSGFVLAEALIWLMLTALLLQGLFLVLASSFLSWKTSVAQMEAHQSARMAMETMTRELRLASVITWPLPGEQASGIHFTKREANGNVQTLIYQQGSTSGYNSHTLYRINTPGEPTPLTQNYVSELYFQFQPPRLVLISLTVTDPRTKVSDTLQTHITCINVSD